MRRFGNARIPILAAWAVALVGTLGIWLVGSPIEDDGCSSTSSELNVREGQGVSTTPGFAPPTTWDCEIHGRGESRTETVFPYLLWLYFAATIGLAVWIGVEPKARVVGLALLGLVLVGALFVLAFFNATLSAAVGTLILAAWLLFSLTRAGPAAALGD